VAVIVSTAFCHLDNVLLMGGRAWLSLVNVAASLLVMVVLYAVLIPRFDLTGAAVAWAVGVLVYNIGPWWPVRRALGLRGVGPEALYVAPGTLGAFVAASLARVLWGSSVAATLAAFAVAGVVFVLAARQFAGPLRLAELPRTVRPPREPRTAVGSTPCAVERHRGTTEREISSTGSDGA
jgi:O-antigen/teichoic acid export membrane protein